MIPQNMKGTNRTYLTLLGQTSIFFGTKNQRKEKKTSTSHQLTVREYGTTMHDQIEEENTKKEKGKYNLPL